MWIIKEAKEVEKNIRSNWELEEDQDSIYLFESKIFTEEDSLSSIKSLSVGTCSDTAYGNMSEN